MASGSYAVADYHGVFRSAAVAEASSSVLAVELHFTDATQRDIDFNAFLAYAAGISNNNNCVPYYGNVTVIGTGITNPGKAFDFTRNTGYDHHLRWQRCSHGERLPHLALPQSSLVSLILYHLRR